jgi:hypothetical protein
MPNHSIRIYGIVGSLFFQLALEALGHLFGEENIEVVRKRADEGEDFSEWGIYDNVAIEIGEQIYEGRIEVQNFIDEQQKKLTEILQKNNSLL